MYYWSLFPLCITLYILIMKYLTSTKLSGFEQTSVYRKPVVFFSVSLTWKNPKNYWSIWQYISGWRFFHKLKSVRLVLGTGYLERFKSSMIFYKVRICPIALDFSSCFYSKNVKVCRMFLMRINSYFFQIYIECCSRIFPIFGHLNYNTFTFLLSKVTSLQYFVFCIRKVRYLSPTLDTYLLFYFLPALYSFEGKGPLYPPTHPPKKLCLYCITRFFQIYCTKSQFLLESSMIYSPKYKIKILCVSTIV